MSINNSKGGAIPQSLLTEYINLYKIVGKGENNYNLLNSKYNYYHDTAISDDIFYLFKGFYSYSKVNDQRIKQFAEKESIETIRNKDEQLLKNLKEVFKVIYKYNTFELTTNEVIDLSRMLFNKVLDNTNSFIRSFDNNQKSKQLDAIVNKYLQNKKNNTLDPLMNACEFLIDYLYLSPFKEGNEIIGIILFYVLIINSDLVCFRYSSFFKELVPFLDEYKTAIKKGFYMYDDGMSDSSPLLRLLFKISLNSYKKVDELISEIDFDKNLSKSSIVQNVIYKLDDTFSKNDIEKALPGISKSTIDRTLKELSISGKIQAIGVGRSAKWIRLDHSKDKPLYLKEDL